MNRKGFTLIELLAVLVVLGIVLVISIPSITDAYKNSKIKSEEAFVQRLTQTIDSYVKLNSDEITFNGTGKEGVKKQTEKKYNKETEQYESIEVYYDITYQKGTVKVSDIINSNDSKILTQKDFINAGNKDVSCNTDAEIEVYKDSDFVYCYKMPITNLKCLSDNYKEKYKDETYAINTCAWTEKTE